MVEEITGLTTVRSLQEKSRISKLVTDQIGQVVMPGKRVVFQKTDELATGIVQSMGPLFVRVVEDGTTRVVTKKPWQCVVYGENYRPCFKDIAV